MDIAALQAFIAVADLRSFSAAAERIHLTQPAVSKRVAQLESLLDERLFDRIGRQVLLTEAGRVLYPRARRILAEVEDSRREVHNLSGRVDGVLALATSHHVGLHRLPPILRRYRTRFPAARLDLRFMASEAAYAAIGDGEVELAVVTLDPQPVPGLETVALWADRMVPVCIAGGPLAGPGPVRAADLTAHPAIFPGPETFTRQVIDRALCRLGVDPAVELSTNYLETIKMMVTVGLGWSVLPVGMVDGQLRVVELPGLEITRSLGVIRNPARTLSNAAAAMLELLQAAAGR